MTGHLMFGQEPGEAEGEAFAFAIAKDDLDVVYQTQNQDGSKRLRQHRAR